MIKPTAKFLKQLITAAAFGAVTLTSVQAGWLCDWRSDSYRNRPWYNPACEPNWGYQITDWRHFPEQYAQQYGSASGDYCPPTAGVATGVQSHNVNMLPAAPSVTGALHQPGTSTATPVIIQPPVGAAPTQVPELPASSAPYQLPNQPAATYSQPYSPAVEAPSSMMNQPGENNLPPAIPMPSGNQSFSPQALPQSQGLPQPGMTPQLNYDAAPAPNPSGNALPPLPGSARLMQPYQQNVPTQNVSFPGQSSITPTINNQPQQPAYGYPGAVQEVVLPNGQLPQWPQSEVTAFTPQLGQQQFAPSPMQTLQQLQPQLQSPDQALAVPTQLTPQNAAQTAIPKPSLLDRLLLRRPIGPAQEIPVQNTGITPTATGVPVQNPMPLTPVMMQTKPSRNPFSLLSRTLRK